MKKFLMIYRMDMAKMREMMTNTPPEEMKKSTEEWGMWMQANVAHFADVGGPVGKNTEVSANGAEEKSNDVAGYSIIQAESKEAAVALLAGSPHFKMPGSTADVMEVFNMGM